MKPLLLILIVLLPLLNGLASSLPSDSVQIRYEIVEMQFLGDHNLIKIKVPDFLTTSQVMEQCKLVVFWPGQPPPQKPIYIYVFRDSDPVGSTSKTGCVYLPGKGFRWDLRDWHPDRSLYGTPTERELKIYYSYIDTLIKEGMSLTNQKAKEEVAKEFGIDVSRIDSIYTKVKFWLEKHPVKIIPRDSLNQ